MDLAWEAYLRNRHAIIEDGRVVHYGDAPAELERTQSKSAAVFTDLSHLGVIRFEGEDAQSFLQGQLTCDVRQIGLSTASYGGYCNPKGRVLASFLIWRDPGGYVMQLPSSLQSSIRKRLSMYVLRAKVRLTDASSNLVRLGVSGERAGKLVEEMLGEPPHLTKIPATRPGAVHGPQGSAISLAEDRFELLVASEQAPSVWERLSKEALPVGAPCWDWIEVNAGIPVITAATQEQFVPQMVNLDAIGGISFQKGCYPGQEIVARSQYLGKIKRRMYLANIRQGAHEIPIKAGDELFGSDMGQQCSGMVLNAAASPQGGFDVLAVVQTSSIETGSIHWASLDGPVLEIMPLPYSVSQ